MISLRSAVVKPKKNGEFSDSGWPLLVINCANCAPSAMSAALVGSLLGSIWPVMRAKVTILIVCPGSTAMGKFQSGLS